MIDSEPGMRPPGYLVIEGPIGVGKTSLARKLAESFNSTVVLEETEGNPFLERFYRNKGSFALATQLHFLFQRVQQLQDLSQGDLFRKEMVADFLFEKDRLFAEFTLDSHELNLYRQVCDRFVMDAPTPDLVVYLQAPVDVLRNRIARRARPQEMYIEPAYLARLADAYTRFFHDYEAAPLLIVNAADINLVDSNKDYELLLQRICNTGPGKHYFNPLPLGLE